MASHTGITKESFYQLEKLCAYCLNIRKHPLLAVSFRSLGLGMGWGGAAGRGSLYIPLTQRQRTLEALHK